jgi:predicted peptidase
MPTKIAAIVPLAGVLQNYNSNNKSQVLANNNLPIWAFHSNNDPIYSINDVRGFIDKVNSFNPSPAAKLTVWPTGGHDAWTRALDPTYKEAGMNMYEWMLQFHR